MSSLADGKISIKNNPIDLGSGYKSILHWFREKTPTQKKVILGAGALGTLAIVTITGVSIFNSVRTAENPVLGSTSDLESMSCTQYMGLDSVKQHDIASKLFVSGYGGDYSYDTNQFMNLWANVLKGCTNFPRQTVGDQIQYTGAAHPPSD